MINFYAILEIKPASDYKEIKEAYRRLSKKFHPDLNNGDKACEEKFKAIQQAYATLKDPYKRKNYDLKYRAYKDSLNLRRKAATRNLSSKTAQKSLNRNFKSNQKGKVQLTGKEKYWAAGGAGFLLIVILLIMSLEKTLYQRETYLEMSEPAPEVPLKDSAELIQGFKADTVNIDKNVFIKTLSPPAKK